MKTEIHRLSLGMCYCYLIKEEGMVLVDAGFPDQEKKFIKELKNLSIKPGDISLIILTHSHYDHIGSASAIKRLTGAKVAVNQREKDWVEKAIIEMPPAVGLSGKISRVFIKMMTSGMSFPGTPVDSVLGDDDYSLKSYGINGKIVYTPGHSSGSVNVLLYTGDAFVGDLVMNGFPMRFGLGMPVFAENTGHVKESWRKLLDSGARKIHLAHGKPFHADKLRKLL